jgi:hypothetical protein
MVITCETLPISAMPPEVVPGQADLPARPRREWQHSWEILFGEQFGVFIEPGFAKHKIFRFGWADRKIRGRGGLENSQPLSEVIYTRSLALAPIREGSGVF